MNILVTGASGFVGIHIVKRLAECGASVVALAPHQPDAALERFLYTVQPQVKFVQGDVRGRPELIELARRAQVERIVHGAGITPTLEREHNDAATVVDVNFGGTLNILEAARACGAARVVFVSSSGIYGAPNDRAQIMHEDQPSHTTNLYTMCKLASEQLCRRYRELFGLSTASGRLGSAYGPIERSTDSRQTMSALFTLAHAALDGRRIRVFAADTVRDFCYIEDVANAFAGLTLAHQLSWDIYNVSAGTSYSLREACTILKVLVPTFEWETTDNPEQADVRLSPTQARGPMDISRLRHDTGFQPGHDLSTGLERYLECLRHPGLT